MADPEAPASKPDPANPLSNPSALPGHGPAELPPRQPNEIPPGDPQQVPGPDFPAVVRHPLGPPEPEPGARA
jgi:hypothetical protein